MLPKITIKLIATTFVLSVSSLARAEEINIAVAANFAAPMQEIVAAFENTTQHRVSVSLGSSGKFYAQIRNGAPFQLFFSADQAKPNALEHDGLIVSGSRFTYAQGALALWSANDDFVVNASFDFTADGYKLALANPKLAPYGKAAIETLESMGMKEISQHNWVLGENIAQTYQFVHSQNAGLGFVAVSQIMRDGKIARGSAWLVPSGSHHPIRQDVVMLKRGENSKTTQDFLDFVRSETAQKIIQSYGYTTPSQTQILGHGQIQ